MLYFYSVKSIEQEIAMSKIYKTKIEITSAANDKDEAIEIVGDYLSGNINSGIGLKYSTKQIRFYDHSAAKAVAILILIGAGFFFSAKTSVVNHGFNAPTCQMAAVQPPLKTSIADKDDVNFKKEWEEKQTREAIDFIKR